MSVLITGMEMPTSCGFCLFEKHTDDGYECCINGCLTEYQKRPSDCPLVPVPAHGRLIDEQWLKDAMITTLEALKKNPKMDRQEMHLIAAFDTLRVMVEDAPTIIPAEEGE